MSKLVAISGREICQILGKLGFERVRQKGSHIYFRHQDGRATVVPMHSGEDLGKGLIRGILRDIEITVDEYDRLRRKVS